MTYKTKTVPFQARQGDIMIAQVSAIPDEAKPVAPIGGSVVLAQGSATGHRHHIAQDQAKSFEHRGVLYLRVPESADLLHDEHGTIHIPAGVYRVIRQREYTPAEIRTVMD